MATFVACLRTHLAAVLLCAVVPSAVAAPYLGPEEGEISLNTSVTVSGEGIKLGDIFNGHPLYEEKIVAPAPAPGERITLTADKLAEIAHTYDVAWKPSDAYDRAVVYRPGHVVTPAEILAAFKADLVAKGMPANLGLRPGGTLPSLIAPEEAVPAITVREGFFDPITKTFSAIAEIAGADGKPCYVRVRGSAFTTVIVPVLKEDAMRPKVITADMIENAEVAEAAVRHDTIVDAAGLVGKSPLAMIRAGQPVQEAEVARLNLVDIPVLRSDMDRDDVIRESNLTWTTMNAAALPADVVTTKDYLIGKSPRHMVAGNAPIRRGDVLNGHQVMIAVAARDVQRGEAMDKESVSWIPAGDETVENGVINDETDLAGRVANYRLRAGQPIRAIDIVRPVVISKDKLVTIIYATPSLKLTVRGKALENGGDHETIRIANANSKSVVLAEVIDANTVKVTSQQIAVR